jgi:hypothetical protein
VDANKKVKKKKKKKKKVFLSQMTAGCAQQLVLGAKTDGKAAASTAQSRCWCDGSNLTIRPLPPPPLPLPPLTTAVTAAGEARSVARVIASAIAVAIGIVAVVVVELFSNSRVGWALFSGVGQPGRMSPTQSQSHGSTAN